MSFSKYFISLVEAIRVAKIVKVARVARVIRVGEVEVETDFLELKDRVEKLSNSTKLLEIIEIALN